MHVALDIQRTDEIGEARRRALRTGGAAGLAPDRLDALAIVVTEMATNLVRHAGGGRLLLLPSTAPGRLDVLAIDTGPGIADLQRALEDGYSSRGSMGTGLGTIRRLADGFDVFSHRGEGTIVLARFGGRDAGSGGQGFCWSGIGIAAPGETVCGDAWAVRIEGREAFVVVADGLGHGPLAAEAADAATAAFGELRATGPAEFLLRAHERLLATRGAAIAMARVRPDRSSLDYAGIGNVAGSVLQPGADDVRPHGLVSLPGTAGKEVRKPLETSTEWRADSMLVMHTDGISSRWSASVPRSLLARDTAVVAAWLYRGFRRGRDDATVVVLEAEFADHG